MPICAAKRREERHLRHFFKKHKGVNALNGPESQVGARRRPWSCTSYTKGGQCGRRPPDRRKLCLSVYVMHPPVAGAVYVGHVDRREQLPQRIINHFADANAVGTPREKRMRCCREIRALLDAGFDRDQFAFELTDFPDEDAAIAYYRSAGWECWNEAKGGAGRPSKHRAVDWDNADVRALLGSAPDAEVGRALGVHADTVTKHRKKLGIPPCNARRAA